MQSMGFVKRKGTKAVKKYLATTRSKQNTKVIDDHQIRWYCISEDCPYIIMTFYGTLMINKVKLCPDWQFSWLILYFCGLTIHNDDILWYPDDK